MSSNPQVPSSSEAPSLAPGPFTPSDFRILFTAVDIFRSLGGLQKAVDNLEATTKSNVEKIEQLFHKSGETASHIPIFEKALARNEKDINELGRRHDKDIHELEKIAHTIKTLGIILLSSGIVTAFLTYIFHRFSK
jgi:wobble nucleotide-excising tRNase